MNNEQLLSIIRIVMQVAGTALVTKGYLTASQFASISDQGVIAVGACLSLGSAVWAVYKRSDKNLVKAARQVQEKRDGITRNL